MEDHHLFFRWKTGTTHQYWCASSPLSLLILGALRYLGRGWTFEDIEESTAIDEETHQQFFHVFIQYGSTTMYDKYVITPKTPDDASTHIREMELAGFPGCFGSTDATHIAMDSCAYRLRQAHKGFKLPYPSRTYNLTANHRR